MEIIRHQILILTLYFLTGLPTREDGVENRDKVYYGYHKNFIQLFFFIHWALHMRN